ncbi:hypothetical protein [Nitrosovibrio sp. Nv6]|uniref:hypothetical protein n=1 Tax=Nitrosovibrio sp. Nv6 TaxID=1855340 RepID=UPI0008B2943D|nr:hypothetical protein [Nitrosovibrio sp. Nv6]SEO71464.1 Beta/Gamma crystallin [Nitrosovibrio sp. Nv6]
MKKKGLLAALLTFVLAIGINTAATAQEQDPSKNKDKNDALAPIIMLVPPIFAIDSQRAGGCWARLYPSENYKGDVLLLAGPIDVPKARVGDFDWGRKYESLVVGPDATLTVYDNEFFKDKVATFEQGQRAPKLDKKLGLFENIRSLTLSCAK